jgi:hypothetical protein
MDTINQRIEELNLPLKAKSLILEDLELAKYILAEKNKFPFPANYIPSEIEVRFNNVLHFKTINDQIVFSHGRIIGEDFMEWKFDNECALFQVGSLVLIDRIENLVTIQQLNQQLIASAHGNL